VIIGSGTIGREIAHKISSRPELMRELVGFLCPSNSEVPCPIGIAVDQSISLPDVEISEFLKRNGVQELILAGAHRSAPQTYRLLEDCRAANIDVCMVPQSYELYSSHAQVIDLAGLPMIQVNGWIPSRSLRILKPIFDFLLGIPILIVLSPLIGLFAFFIVLSGRAPFRKEVRCGKNGLTFNLYRLNIERYSSTLVGFSALMDRLSLTELPQLLNVLRGEMSLVGPRPEDPERVKHYSEWQKKRLLVKPGLTGLAQVHGLRDNHPSDEKARFDLQYIQNWSPFLDVTLLLQTAWTIAVRLSKAGRAPAIGTAEHSERIVTLGDVDVNSAQSSAD
jgi:lipopolysaccharide/colanic/teichoic acid biosynthesis glycosyltransferase